MPSKKAPSTLKQRRIIHHEVARPLQVGIRLSSIHFTTICSTDLEAEADLINVAFVILYL